MSCDCFAYLRHHFCVGAMGVHGSEEHDHNLQKVGQVEQAFSSSNCCRLISRIGYIYSWYGLMPGGSPHRRRDPAWCFMLLIYAIVCASGEALAPSWTLRRIVCAFSSEKMLLKQGKENSPWLWFQGECGSKLKAWQHFVMHCYEGV